MSTHGRLSRRRFLGTAARTGAIRRAMSAESGSLPIRTARS